MLSLLVSGCDSGGSDNEASNNPHPTPPSPPAPPTPPVPDILPMALNLNITDAMTSEYLTGSYEYKDDDAEGKSALVWRDPENNVVGQGRTYDYSHLHKPTSVKFCVTPVTFNAREGNEVCSKITSVIVSEESREMSTDWKTDTDFNSGEGPSGNIHFYFNINLEPAVSNAVNTATLKMGTPVPIDRGIEGVHSGFDLDHIYAMSNNNEIKLINKTPRIIEDPVIRINDDNYYVIHGSVPEFSETVIVGYTGKIDTITFMDPNPGYKNIISGYDNYENDYNNHVSNDLGSVLENGVYSTINYPRKKKIAAEVPLAKNSASFKGFTTGYCFQGAPDPCQESLTDDQVEEYNGTFRILKILNNRYDAIKYYFDWFNNDIDLNGEILGLPYLTPNEESVWCSEVDGENDAGCGGGGVEHKYQYRLHALKRILTHARTDYIFDFNDTYYVAGAAGKASIDPQTTTNTVVGIEDRFNANIATFSHENSHRLGYSDASGIPPWEGGNYGYENANADAGAGGLYNLGSNMDFWGSVIPDDKNYNKAIEKSDFIADYHWVDPLTVDVHFYAKYPTKVQSAIKNLVVLAEDEESIKGFSGNQTDYKTYTFFDKDGSLTTQSKISVINKNTVRIKLDYQIVNHSKTLFVAASSADTNDDTGKWKTGYEQHNGDNIALEIPYDKNIEIKDDNNQIAYLSKLSNTTETMRNGNIAHIGQNDDSPIGAPDYYLPESYYEKFSIDEAQSYCQSQGYKGLGLIPDVDSLDILASRVVQFVYKGTVVGLDKNNKAVMIKSDIGSSPYGTNVDPDTNYASLLVCSI